MLFLKIFRVDIPIVTNPSTNKFLWTVSDRLQDKLCSIYLYLISFLNGNFYVILYFSKKLLIVCGQCPQILPSTTFQFFILFWAWGRTLEPFFLKLYLLFWHLGSLLKRVHCPTISSFRVIEVRAGTDLWNLQIKLPHFVDDETEAYAGTVRLRLHDK